MSNLKFDVLALCETSLNDAICTLYAIGDEKYFHNNSTTRGGGLTINVNKTFAVRTLSNLSLQFPYIECMFLKVTKPKMFLADIIYRPPNSDAENCFSVLDTIVITALSHKKPVIS